MRIGSPLTGSPFMPPPPPRTRSSRGGPYRSRRRKPGRAGRSGERSPVAAVDGVDPGGQPDDGADDRAPRDRARCPADEGAEPDADAGAPDGGSATPEDSGTSLTLDAARPAALCAADERLGPDDRCYFFDATLASWATARTACQARGAAWDLVVVRTAALSVFLGDELTFEAWLGATDAASEGQWLWVGDLLPFWTGNGATGSASGGAYANWNPTEPNGGAATNCARALPRSLGSANPNAPWADLDCATPLGAVCESGPPP
jgi:hypothetical protein